MQQFTYLCSQDSHNSIRAFRVMYVTDAIILRKDPIGEADCLVTALTPKYVKIRLVAQGARKVEAKLKGHLEPLSLSRLSFVVGKNNYRLVGAELLRFFRNIKNDPERLRITAEMTHMLDCALFEDRAPGGEVFFDIARDAVAALDADPSGEGSEQTLTWFKVRFLHALGLFPDDHYAILSRVEFPHALSAEYQDIEALTSRLVALHLR